MSLTLQAEPTVTPVSLDEVKAHLNVDFTDEDDVLTGYIEAATQRLDGRDGTLGVCLITQTWTLTLDAFPAEILLPLSPCQSVDEISYIDQDGETQTLATGAYAVYGLGTNEGARILPAYNSTWPDVRAMPDCIAVTFTAGYGDEPLDVPEPIRANIMAYAGRMYADREHMESAADDDLINFKRWSFG